MHGMARMASYDEMMIIALSLQPVKFHCAGLLQESSKEIEESIIKPKDDNQEIIQKNKDETRHEARQETIQNIKLQAAEAKFDHALLHIKR